MKTFLPQQNLNSTLYISSIMLALLKGFVILRLLSYYFNYPFFKLLNKYVAALLISHTYICVCMCRYQYFLIGNSWLNKTGFRTFNPYLFFYWKILILPREDALKHTNPVRIIWIIYVPLFIWHTPNPKSNSFHKHVQSTACMDARVTMFLKPSKVSFLETEVQDVHFELIFRAEHPIQTLLVLLYFYVYKHIRSFRIAYTNILKYGGSKWIFKQNFKKRTGSYMHFLDFHGKSFPKPPLSTKSWSGSCEPSLVNPLCPKLWINENFSF